MAQNIADRWKDVRLAFADERDSKKIGDLIEQLDRDLVQTEKKTSKRR